MPPIPKIKKEDLLKCAYKIAEEKGIAAVTSRNVAELAGCSIQPVFSHFPTMEELRKAAFDYACHKLMDEILQHENQPDFLQFTNQWVLALARKRPNLFELLYLSNSFSQAGLWETILEWECNQKAITMFSEKCGMPETEAKDLFLRCFYMLFGIAAMIYANKIDISDEEALNMIQRTVQESLEAKKNSESNER